MKNAVIALTLLARTTQPAIPVDPLTAIVEAFATHAVVALTDPHGNVEVQQSVLSLVRDPGVPAEPNIRRPTPSASAVVRGVRGEEGRMRRHTATDRSLTNKTIRKSLDSVQLRFNPILIER
jgi:hypothetical protein